MHIGVRTEPELTECPLDQPCAPGNRRMRALRVLDNGGQALDRAVGGVAVHPPAAGAEEDGSRRPLTDVQVEHPRRVRSSGMVTCLPPVRRIFRVRCPRSKSSRVRAPRSPDQDEAWSHGRRGSAVRPAAHEDPRRAGRRLPPWRRLRSLKLDVTDWTAEVRHDACGRRVGGEDARRRQRPVDLTPTAIRGSALLAGVGQNDATPSLICAHVHAVTERSMGRRLLDRLGGGLGVI